MSEADYELKLLDGLLAAVDSVGVGAKLSELAWTLIHVLALKSSRRGAIQRLFDNSRAQLEHRSFDPLI
jgi:hypothetical protein